MHTLLCSAERKGRAKHTEEATQRRFYRRCADSAGLSLWEADEEEWPCGGNQPGASIAVIIIWIQECWVCSFGPLRGWEMTCLCSPDTLSVYSETTHPSSPTTLLCSTLSGWVDECLFNVKTDASPALNLWLHFSYVPLLVTEPNFLQEGETLDPKRGKTES